MTGIRLYNTRTRRKEDFAPLDPENVRMYVCGPTVYDRAHLGNARPVVVFDVLFRLLRHVYGADAVTYVRNFTDVDDKINARAREMQAAGDGRDLNAIIRTLTDQTIGWYHDDMGALGALRPTVEPRATDYIGQMVGMIEGLVAKGHAYVAEGHVLFDVRSYPEYGRLSGRSVDDMIAGARVEVAPYKRDPMDFVLWKPSAADEPGWDGPVWEGKSISRGRPGWHIECSAMAHELLGESFDIHGGGIDLQFPHHENEIAQSCCAHPDGGFARVWMHNEMVQVDGKKMSKSLGNFFTVRDLLDQGWPGEVIRFVMLQTHYRKPMDWTEEKARAAKAELLRFHRAVKGAPAEFRDENYDTVIEALKDDLNTWGALMGLRRLLHAIEKAEAGDFYQLRMALSNLRRDEYSDSEVLMRAKAVLLDMANLMGILLPGRGSWAQEVDLSDWATKLKVTRENAIIEKDFSLVDEMKAALVDAGIEVRMSKNSVELVPGPDFDPTKLEALK